MTQLVGLKLLSIDVHDDKDHAWIGPASGPGEIYIKYDLTSGLTNVAAQTREYSIADEQGAESLGDSQQIVIGAQQFVHLSFDVYDADWWPDAHDRLNGQDGGILEAHFSEAENFGVGFHVAEGVDYRIAYEIFMT